MSISSPAFGKPSNRSLQHSEVRHTRTVKMRAESCQPRKPLNVAKVHTSNQRRGYARFLAIPRPFSRIGPPVFSQFPARFLAISERLVFFFNALRDPKSMNLREFRTRGAVDNFAPNAVRPFTRNWQAWLNKPKGQVRLLLEAKPSESDLP